VDVTAELQTVRRRSREREQECLKLQQEIQALQSLVSRLQEEMLELHTERDHYQVNDFSLAAHVLLVAMKPIFWYSFFLVIFSLEVCFIHVFHYPTFPCRQ
jgi:uncharacterized protein YlxW (UPF0749 family)